MEQETPNPITYIFTQTELLVEVRLAVIDSFYEFRQKTNKESISDEYITEYSKLVLNTLIKTHNHISKP